MANAATSPENTAAVEALLHSDRVDLAAHLLVDTFTATIGQPYPKVHFGEVARTLGRTRGIVLRSKLGWSGNRLPDGTVGRVALDLGLAWQRAGLVSWEVLNESGAYVLMLRGEVLLSSDAPLAAVRERISACDDERSIL